MAGNQEIFGDEAPRPPPHLLEQVAAVQQIANAQGGPLRRTDPKPRVVVENLEPDAAGVSYNFV